MNFDSTPSHDPQRVGEVSFPFSEEQFKHFIVGLLGKAQTITKRFSGSYQIDRHTIITLFELLDQRILQQNEAKLIQFKATIYYDDNSTVTLNGFDHLVHYNETLPLVSKAIHLTWQYLIKFRDKSSVEKQEINVSFITETDSHIHLDEDMIVYAHNNYAAIRIQHTARSWGADIEALLTRHLNTIVQKNSKMAEFLIYRSEQVQNLVSAFLTLISLSFAVGKTYNLRTKRPSILDTIFWIHHYSNIVFLFTGTFILLKGAHFLLEQFEIYTIPSFILLTPQSHKDMEKALKSYKYNWRRYLGTIIGSLVLGVAGNYIYAWITSK